MKRFKCLVTCVATAYKTVEVEAKDCDEAAARATVVASDDRQPWKLSDELETGDIYGNPEDAQEVCKEGR